MKPSIYLALFLTLLASESFAKGKKDKGEMAQKMKQELNLSDEQLEKIKEIRKSKRESQKEMRTQMKRLRDDLHASLGNPKSSKEEIMDKFNKLQSLKQELSKKKIETMLEIRAQLDEKQISKFHELRKGSKQRWNKKTE